MAGNQQQEQQSQVVLPDIGTPVSGDSVQRGTPAHQQDLPDDGDTSEFAMEAFEVVTGRGTPQALEVDPNLGQQAPGVPFQQPAFTPQAAPQPVQQPAEAGIEPEFRLFPDQGGEVSYVQPVVGTPGTVPQPQQQPGVPQAPAQAQPQAQPGQLPQAPVTVPGQPQAQPQAPQGPAASVDPFEFAARQIAAQEVQFTEQLSKVYKASDEDMAAFAAGDGTIPGKLAARVHVNVLGSVMKIMAQQMPVVFHGLIKAHQLNERAEQKFWGTAKFLNGNDQTHRAAVTQATQAFRYANPQADENTTYRMVALMAAAALNIDPSLAFAQQQQPQGQQPQRMPIQTPGRVVRQVQPAYQPVAPNGSHGNSAARTPVNPWDITASIVQADERGMFDPQG